MRARVIVLSGLLLALGCGGDPPRARTAGSPAVARAAPVPSVEEPPRRCEANAVEGTTVESGEVEGATPGLRCCVYLRKRGPHANHVVFVQSGTGIYTTADGALGAVAMRALELDDFALLTMDKPGISADARGALRFDRTAYRRYTLPDLVACGTHALAWARRAVEPRAGLVLHGHSEGGQVVVQMLAAPARAFPFERIEHAIVTGLPLEPFVDAAERQIAFFMPFEIEAFHEAIERNDDDYLLQHALSSAYLAHPSSHRNFAEVLTELATARPEFPLEMFHGDRDLNAPLDLVKSFVARNDAARGAGRPALDVRLRVYPGARHYLDRRFAADVETMLVRRAPVRAKAPAPRE